MRLSARRDARQQGVAASRSARWRHLPTALLVTSLVLLTTAMAGPPHNIRVPLDRAVVMLVMDVSESMAATDVKPSRLGAAQQAAKQFAGELTPDINLGLVEFASTATLLVSPTTDHAAVKAAIDGLRPSPQTATGEGLFTALQAIATVGAVMAGGAGPPPARVVLLSDGAETLPMNPNDPQGAYSAARAAKAEGVQISTIAFGTPNGAVVLLVSVKSNLDRPSNAAARVWPLTTGRRASSARPPIRGFLKPQTRCVSCQRIPLTALGIRRGHPEPDRWLTGLAGERDAGLTGRQARGGNVDTGDDPCSGGASRRRAEYPGGYLHYAGHDRTRGHQHQRAGRRRDLNPKPKGT